MKKHLLLPLLLLVIALLACAKGQAAPLAPSSPTVFAPAGTTPIPFTPTTSSTLPLPHTLTLAATTAPAGTTPTFTPLPAPERINFAPGAISATRTGTLGQNDLKEYVLNAQAGQIMSIALTSPTGNALLTIYGSQDNEILKRDAVGGPSWTGPLAVTQDYIIIISTAGPPTDYVLSVEIPPVPQPIHFAPGAAEDVIAGTLQAGETDTYILAAQVGQIMTVWVDGGATLLKILGVHGPILTTGINGAIGWSGTLPLSQDYQIQVSSGAAGNYNLHLTISPLILLPTEIQFPAGAISATVTDNLAAGGDLQQYILGAAAGQIMTLTFYSSQPGAVSVSVHGVDDNYLGWATEPDSLTILLPATQDYIITVSTPGIAPFVTYSLTVTIP